MPLGGESFDRGSRADGSAQTWSRKGRIAAVQRNTAQRRAICDVFLESGRPLGPTEVHKAARRRMRRLGIATVYRAIRDLVDEGWLALVELPGQPARYERAGKEHHHHFVCNHCDRVFEVEGCPGDIDADVPAGFQLETHDVLLYGRCATCAA